MCMLHMLHVHVHVCPMGRAGTHTLRVVGGAAAGEVGQAGEGPVLAHLFVHVFAAPSPSEALPSVGVGGVGGGGAVARREHRIGAFPVSGPEGVVGYRPTQDACLMRDMTR